MHPSAQESAQKGIRAALVSVVTNTTLAALKFWAGAISGSVALIADAWHTLSDSITSFIVIVGIKLSRKKATVSHPFGYGRWEQIAALVCGFILAVVAYEFTIDAIDRLKHNTAANFGLIAILVISASIIVKESLAQYAFWVYRKTGLITMKAEGWHHRSDALSSIPVLVGIFIGKYFGEMFWWMDGVLGIIVALSLFWASYEIIKSAINKLLGERVPIDLEQDIKAYICKHFGGYYTHHYHIHSYGDVRELTFHLHVNGYETVEESHKLATHIENALKKQFHLECTIHIEPESQKSDLKS
ncbi:MAG: cation diffusion facilitator family transporter [Bacteroidales bacterium]|nr:cation diffusion facilitator family transporter [Bacteroidales bacterium]